MVRPQLSTIRQFVRDLAPMPAWATVSLVWTQVAPIWTLMSLIWTLAGCTPTKPLLDKQMAPVTPFLGPVALPSGPVAASPWSTQACTPGKLAADVVACVGGAAIPVARVNAIRATYPPETPVRAIVQALVDEELLAQAARKTLWGDWLEPVLRRQMVAHLLEVQFEREFTLAQISDSDLEKAWAVKQVRHTYDHPGVYTVTDAQIICCKGADQACKDSEEARACIDEEAPTAKLLAEFLQANKPRSGMEMAGRVGTDRRFAKVAVIPYTFFYDPTKSFKEQGKYMMPVEPFSLTAMKMQPGDLVTEPVRTPFGWHVFRMEKRVEPEHGQLTDPKVREALRKDLLDPMRDDKVDLLVEGLARATGVELHTAVFDPPGSADNSESAGGPGATP